MTLLATGLQDKTELVLADPFSSAELREANPLGRVPALITPDLKLFDSPLICEYLDKLAVEQGQASLFGKRTGKYFNIQASHTQANGIIEAAVASVMETRRTTEKSEYWLTRWEDAIKAAVQTHSLKYLGDNTSINIATIATGAALAYLDFRLSHLNWRQWNPELAQWFANIETHEFMATTRPE